MNWKMIMNEDQRKQLLALIKERDDALGLKIHYAEEFYKADGNMHAYINVLVREGNNA